MSRAVVMAILDTVQEFFEDAGAPLTEEQLAVVECARTSGGHCPGSTRTPRDETTKDGSTVGACRSCGKWQRLRMDGTIKLHANDEAAA